MSLLVLILAALFAIMPGLQQFLLDLIAGIGTGG
jgi:hypothetical protein